MQRREQETAMSEAEQKEMARIKEDTMARLQLRAQAYNARENVRQLTWGQWLHTQVLWKIDHMIMQPLFGLLEVIFGACPMFFRHLWQPRSSTRGPVISRLWALGQIFVHILMGICLIGHVPLWISYLQYYVITKTYDLALLKAKEKAEDDGPGPEEDAETPQHLSMPENMRDKLMDMTDAQVAGECWLFQGNFHRSTAPWELCENAARRLLRAKGKEMTREEWFENMPVPRSGNNIDEARTPNGPAFKKIMDGIMLKKEEEEKKPTTDEPRLGPQGPVGPSGPQ